MKGPRIPTDNRSELPRLLASIAPGEKMDGLLRDSLAKLGAYDSSLIPLTRAILSGRAPLSDLFGSARFRALESVASERAAAEWDAMSDSERDEYRSKLREGDSE